MLSFLFQARCSSPMGAATNKGAPRSGRALLVPAMVAIAGHYRDIERSHQPCTVRGTPTKQVLAKRSPLLPRDGTYLNSAPPPEVDPFVGFYGHDRRILSSCARDHARLLHVGGARQHKGGAMNISSVHAPHTPLHRHKNFHTSSLVANTVISM